jgi:hypothetical protein
MSLHHVSPSGHRLKINRDRAETGAETYAPAEDGEREGIVRHDMLHFDQKRDAGIRSGFAVS